MNWDISLFKNIPLGSSPRQLQFRCELWHNAFNTDQCGGQHDRDVRLSDRQQTNTAFGS
jgi:hypothetical protein